MESNIVEYLNQSLHFNYVLAGYQLKPNAALLSTITASLLFQYPELNATVIIPSTYPPNQVKVLKALSSNLVYSDSSVESVKKYTNLDVLLDFSAECYTKYLQTIKESYKFIIVYVNSPSQSVNWVKACKEVHPSTTIVCIAKNQISYGDAVKACKDSFRSGVLCGLESGSVLHYSKYLCEGSRLAILSDSAFLYPELFEDEQLDLGSRFPTAIVDDLQLPEATTVFDTQSVRHAIEIMQMRDFSQLPVVNEKRKIVGLIKLESGLDGRKTIREVMSKFSKKEIYKIVTPDTGLDELEEIFVKNNAVFVTDSTAKFVLAVVTREDVIKFNVRNRLIQ